MKVALLGPVELADADGHRVDVASRRARQLLIVLGLGRGRPVETDTIVELIWGDDRPADPAATVQTNVSRLRRLLTDPVTIETGPSGYRLLCPDDHLDVNRFEAVVARTRGAAPDRVPDLAAEAQRLWRGTPLPDLDHPEIESERQRLTELRLEVDELLAEALHAEGRFGEAIALTERLVRESHYRERPVAALMRSLFAAGRQVDALSVFADLRSRLLEDLGVDPSHALRDLEMAILRQELDIPGQAKPPAPVDDWIEVDPDDVDLLASNGAGTADDVDDESGSWSEVDPATVPPPEPDQATNTATAAVTAAEAAGHGSVPASQRIRICTTADGTRLAYATSGSGPPLVKAANWMTHLDYDWESPVWRHWNRDLSQHRTLVRYDERGCGLSDRDVEFSFDAWVDDLAAVVDAHGIDRFPLLGISQGGAVAIAYAVAHPERVSHLVLWGAYGRGRGVRAVTEEQKREADLNLELARVGWGTGDATFRQVFTSMFMPDGTREQWEAFNELQWRTCSSDNAVRFMEVFAAIDVIDLAPQVSCPTLVMHSRNELRVPFDSAVELAGLLPHSQLVPLESRNHILLEDEPAWPRFLAELDTFLSDT